MIGNIYAHVAISGNTQFVISGGLSESATGFCVHFSLHRKYSEREAKKVISSIIEKSSIDWVDVGEREWEIDAERAKKQIPALAKLGWFKGVVHLKPDLELDETEVFGEPKQESVYRLFVLKEEVLMKANVKVFLSHKGKNKDLVRDFNSTLNLIGFDTWLDEDAMNAGALLERSLLDGMKKSCAAVFFVTPQYVDEGYLETEVDYAVQQKRERGDDFQIITLSLKDSEGTRGSVPELLRRFVWKEPNSELEALREIIKAIPLTLPKPRKDA